MHIPSVLALECSSNVVGTQWEYSECCHNVQNTLQMPYEFSSIAAGIKPEVYSWKMPPMTYTNVVRMLPEWLPNTVRAFKNSNKM